MKKTAILCLGAAILLSSLAVGCSGGSEAGGSIEFKTIKSGTTYRLLNSAREFDADGDITYADSVCLLMPVRIAGADIAPLRDSIMSLAFDSVGSDINTIMEKYIERTASQLGYPLERLDSMPSGTTPDGFTSVDGSVVNLTPEVLVYCVSNYQYQPHAAHGMSTDFYINYDIAGSRVLSARDIFRPETTDSLVATIQTQADALEQVIGPTTITALPANDNFMLSPGGEIVFVYQPYEVASYAQGKIRVSFYPYELVDYMTPFAVNYFKLSDIGR